MTLPSNVFPFGGPIADTTISLPTPTEAMYNANVVSFFDGKMNIIVRTGESGSYSYGWVDIDTNFAQGIARNTQFIAALQGVVNGLSGSQSAGTHAAGINDFFSNYNELATIVKVRHNPNFLKIVDALNNGADAAYTYGSGVTYTAGTRTAAGLNDAWLKMAVLEVGSANQNLLTVDGVNLLRVSGGNLQANNFTPAHVADETQTVHTDITLDAQGMGTYADFPSNAKALGREVPIVTVFVRYNVFGEEGEQSTEITVPVHSTTINRTVTFSIRGVIHYVNVYAVFTPSTRRIHISYAVSTEGGSDFALHDDFTVSAIITHTFEATANVARTDNWSNIGATVTGAAIPHGVGAGQKGYFGFFTDGRSLYSGYRNGAGTYTEINNPSISHWGQLDGDEWVFGIAGWVVDLQHAFIPPRPVIRSALEDHVTEKWCSGLEPRTEISERQFTGEIDFTGTPKIKGEAALGMKKFDTEAAAKADTTVGILTYTTEA